MPARFQDYYATLDVPRTATAEEIKQGFRKLARLHHPDVARDQSAGESKFKEINEAYEVLGDHEKRRRYDAILANGRTGSDTRPGDEFSPQSSRHDMAGSPSSAGAGYHYEGTGFSDFFAHFFGAREHEVEADADMQADISVSLAEALRGATRKITLLRPGSSATNRSRSSYQVRIPPGIREGQRIRLVGQGVCMRAGAMAGDLFLRVRLAPHPLFSVDGPDLLSDLDLAPWEAVLGARVNIPTLDGETTLQVPAGTAAGTRLRLRGLGMPRETGGRGDLLVAVRVCTPTTISEAERTLWEKLAAITHYHPRPIP